MFAGNIWHCPRTGSPFTIPRRSTNTFPRMNTNTIPLASTNTNTCSCSPIPSPAFGFIVKEKFFPFLAIVIFKVENRLHLFHITFTCGINLNFNIEVKVQQQSALSLGSSWVKILNPPWCKEASANSPEISLTPYLYAASELNYFSGFVQKSPKIPNRT